MDASMRWVGELLLALQRLLGVKCHHMLMPGERLNRGQSIYANQYKLQQEDQKLVLYQGTVPIWSNGCQHCGVMYTIMQHDGNLVSYDKTGQPVWSTDTHAAGACLMVRFVGLLGVVASLNMFCSFEGAEVLWECKGRKRALHNNLIEWTGAGRYDPNWSCGTPFDMSPGKSVFRRSRNAHTLQPMERLDCGQHIAAGQYRLVQQEDHNLVLYHNGAQKWANNRTGSDAMYTLLHLDGYLASYNSSHRCVWSSSSVGDGAAQEGAQLVLTQDGLLGLVLEDPVRVLWECLGRQVELCQCLQENKT
ncbi:hypothetical protein JKP88DRAFT_267812 [Tribonema minus]|uniref:Bulb-type lectin domain-containing protein n=1 Tax=Tribonema minus TaxID=303371 RepID=A0A835ZCC0_9STRA|nr:hypothetical protein JKP88DRAFT_267812 [Tribonema minus]